jgi:hypothetical protein
MQILEGPISFLKMLLSARAWQGGHAPPFQEGPISFLKMLLPSGRVRA